MDIYWYYSRKKTNAVDAMFWILRVLIVFEIYVKTARSDRGTDRGSRETIPTFFSTPRNVTVHKGELATLGCHIMNLGTKVVVWRKSTDEHPLTIGKSSFAPKGDYSVDQIMISDQESKWNLLIKNVQPKHAGLYECQISSTGTYVHYVSLTVLDEPVPRESKLHIEGTQYVDQSSDIHLICNVTDSIPLTEDVDWFFEGNKIHESHPRWAGRIELLRHRDVARRSYISELIVHKSNISDNGNYVCRSSDLNVKGIKVHVLVVPEKIPIVERAPGEEKHKEMGESNALPRNVGTRRCELSVKLSFILALSLILRRGS